MWRARFRYALLFLCAAVLSFPATAGPIVLCICHDGHIDLEGGACTPEQCCPAEECSLPEDRDGMGSDKPEHPCTDIPLPRLQVNETGRFLIVPANAGAILKAPFAGANPALVAPHSVVVLLQPQILVAEMPIHRIGVVLQR